ncbi:MAG: hypothetical protein KatS3mg060_3318 [Dehalococcoidia bacterium]|jgi:hypothetical protein|nr:MAG: hypothetical protein KatS3mg060_3318 [Dehalococcoidia bacterium]
MMGDVLGLLATAILVLAAIVIANLAVIGLLVVLPVVLIRRAVRRVQRRFLPMIRPGRVSDGMREFWGVANRRAVQLVLRRSLPAWPISSKLVDAAGELADLRAGAAAALAAGVPLGIIRPIHEEAVEASDAVWRIADRVTAAAAQRVDARLLAPALDPEIEKLTNLIVAIRQARESLAQLTLSHVNSRELEKAERRLRALDEATRAVAALPGW